MPLRWFHFPKVPKAIGRVYVLSALRSFIQTLAGVFLLLLFYERSGLTAAILYPIGYIVGIQLAELLIYLRRRISMERVVLLGISVSSLGTILGSAFPTLLGAFLSGIVVGLGSGAYWLVHHVAYILYGRSQEERAGYSMEVIILNLLNLLSPLAVAIISLFAPPKLTVLLLSILLFLLSLALSGFKETTLDLSPFLRDIKPRLQEGILFMAEGAYISAFFLLPIYLNALGVSFHDMALVVAAVTLVKVVLDYLEGSVDKKTASILATLSVLATALLLLGMIFFPELAPLFYVLIPLDLFTILYTAWLYSSSQRDPTLLTFRENLTLPLGKILVFLTVVATGLWIIPWLSLISVFLLWVTFTGTAGASGD